MDNEEYAELLEKVAARLKKIKTPISQKTISAIGEVSRCIIKEGQMDEFFKENPNFSYIEETDTKLINEENGKKDETKINDNDSSNVK